MTIQQERFGQGRHRSSDTATDTDASAVTERIIIPTQRAVDAPTVSYRRTEPAAAPVPIPSQGHAGPAKPPGKRRRWPWIVLAGFVALMVIGALNQPNTPAAVAPAPAASPAAPAAAASPAEAGSPVASVADRQAAYAALTANVQHYRQMFQQGQAIVGATHYPDAMTSLAEMQDPTSAAARFAAYRQNPNPTADMSLQDTFTRADSHFTADNEPQSISTWRDDVSTAQSDIGGWIDVVVDYQISNKTQADLDAATAKVNADLHQADLDAAAVRDGK